MNTNNNRRKQRTTITPAIISIVRVLVKSEVKVKEIMTATNLTMNAVSSLIKKIQKGMSEEEIIIKKGRKQASTDMIKARITAIVNSNNCVTQKNLVESLVESGVQTSQPVVLRTLEDLEITRKRISLIPEERNSERVIEIRRSYCNEIMHYNNTELVFLGETGFNLHTVSSYGYSFKNTKAYATVLTNRGRNQSLMCVIRSNGVIRYEMIDGAYDGDKFKNFIENHLISYFSIHQDSILVMDNCRFHHRRDVIELLRSQNIPYKFLPPYSPQLNPIEEFFGVIKTRYKSLRPLPVNTESIREAASNIINMVNDDLTNFYNNMRRYIELGRSSQPFI